MYTEESVETFLKNQGQLFDEAVASSYEEAEEFLEDCMAVELKTLKEVRAYFDEAGADISGMTDEFALETYQMMKGISLMRT